MYPLVPLNKLEFSKVVPKNNATHHNKVHSKYRYRYRTGSYYTGNSHSWGMKNQKNCKSTEYLYCTYLGRVPVPCDDTAATAPVRRRDGYTETVRYLQGHASLVILKFVQKKRNTFITKFPVPKQKLGY
jgi:hypothetical protein